MNEELQNALTRIINETIEATGDATVFVLEQAPDVIQQLLHYSFIVSLAVFAGTTLAFLGWTYLCILGIKSTWKDSDNSVAIFSLVGLFIGIGMYISIGFNLDWLQIWIAPKVYLIEYASQMVR